MMVKTNSKIQYPRIGMRFVEENKFKNHILSSDDWNKTRTLSDTRINDNFRK